MRIDERPEPKNERFTKSLESILCYLLRLRRYSELSERYLTEVIHLRIKKFRNFRENVHFSSPLNRDLGFPKWNYRFI